MKNTFAIFCNEQNDILDTVYQHILKNYMTDILVFTDHPGGAFNKIYSTLFSFYLHFYKESIVFLNIDDYMSNRAGLSSSNEVYLLCDVKDLIANGLDKQSLGNVKIIKIENNEVTGL
jgi:hypothetical protein